jgi:hypothetical protein
MKHVPNLHKLKPEQVNKILADAIHNAFQIQVQKFIPNRETITDSIGFIIAEIGVDRHRNLSIKLIDGKHDPYGLDHWEFCYSSMEYYVAIRCGVLDGFNVLKRHELKAVEQ